ncbi:hypothetical protein RF11_03998 [Thelohanellus kitauei]|uniref:Uncharacterized protein n=1 Tax=Thelohanellus kitauei TaxID=669202 RepID=A0A0C2MGE4_THEKT|nr:hypothetical protein RF11_03998 [Thelohanellus kitauei]
MVGATSVKGESLISLKIYEESTKLCLGLKVKTFDRNLVAGRNLLSTRLRGQCLVIIVLTSVNDNKLPYFGRDVCGRGELSKHTLFEQLNKFLVKQCKRHSVNAELLWRLGACGSLKRKYFRNPTFLVNNRKLLERKLQLLFQEVSLAMPQLLNPFHGGTSSRTESTASRCLATSDRANCFNNGRSRVISKL